MRKSCIVLILILLTSCESNSDKNSRLTIDKYARKYSSILDNIAESRKEEGSQSKLTLNRFYDRYSSKIEEYGNDLNFETITPRYLDYRNILLFSSKNLNYYLNFRKEAIFNFTEALNSYEDVFRYKKENLGYTYEAKTSLYSRSFYNNLAFESLKNGYNEEVNFIEKRFFYYKNVSSMDSIYFKLDSLSEAYNTKIKKSRLQEMIIIPTSFQDTINDWLIKDRSAFEKMELPKF
jgi:hypothetical protein